ncbi:hypothetical protein Lepto7375DRAFT_1000 [Leptolyngbya sp. PCC 7375]|nr:hypothetical protein Lepto7375DRAFT_1000 [Leptolyngbya sp. PCC 7375]
MTALATTSATVWQWAKLKFDPSEPRTSNPEWQAQHGVLVVFTDGQEHRIYYNPGVLSLLKRGDTVLCHYRRGKWRMAAEQPPELIQKLEQRRIDSPAHSEFDPVPQAPSVSAVPSAPPAASAKPTSRDVAEIVDIFQELKAALPEAQETTIRAFSSTLFMQRRKEEPEF